MRVVVALGVREIMDGELGWWLWMDEKGLQ